MNGYILDSSFISAFCNSKDVNHDVALNIGRGFDLNIPILIPMVVYAEISRIPYENLREKALLLCLGYSDSILELEEEDLDSYLEFSKKLPKGCTAIDSILLYLAFTYECKLVTFDKGLLRLV